MESVTIQTTQNVSIDYDLGKTGARIGSFFIDGIIFLVLYWILAFLVLSLQVNLDETVIFIFGPIFGLLLYYFLWELFNRGQTLGKRIVGLKVIRLDGRDPTPADFLTRAIFLLPDVLLSFGMPAVLLVASGRHKQRLGDLVAGTVVIQSAVSSSFTLEEIMGIRNREDHEPEFPGVQQYTDEDMMIVKQTLARFRRYSNPAHRRAVRQLAVKMADQLGLEKKEIKYAPEKFLEIILMDYIVLTR
ncbi:MAG: RDD family protein [Bacteroidota bacterium]